MLTLPQSSESETCRGSTAQCTGRSLRQPEALPRLKMAHQPLLLPFGVPHNASTVVPRGEVKRSEQKTSTVLIVIRGLRGQERERCTQPQPEITKGRADGLGSQLLYYTHSALDARTYCFARRSSRIGIAHAERGKQYVTVSTRQPPHRTTFLPPAALKPTTITLRSLALQDSNKTIITSRACFSPT